MAQKVQKPCTEPLQDIQQADVSLLQPILADSYERLRGKPVPPVAVRFYPYTNLNHTIRLRQGRVLVRLSDILADAPAQVLAAISLILLHKLLRRRPPQAMRRLYRDYVGQPSIRRRSLLVRQQRGRKWLTSDKGRHFDLGRLFDDLNQRYFEGRLRIRQLSWSRSRNRRILGHYDEAHRTIIIDRRLDHPRIPAQVVEFVLYHEMLHALHGERIQNGRRWVHHGSFREAERRFHAYEEAQQFIRRRL
ncbi:MAG: M48 family peptidase [Acidobacteriota bacterium]